MVTKMVPRLCAIVVLVWVGVSGLLAHDQLPGPVPGSLVAKLSSEDRETRVAAYRMLHYYTQQDVHTYLEQGINSDDIDVVMASLAPYAHCKSRYYERYLELVEHEDPKVRGIAAVALGRSMSPKRVVPLIKLLDDEVRTTRCYAAEALAFIKDGRALEPLVETMERDKSRSVRCRAAVAVAEMGDPRALDSLMVCLDRGGVGGTGIRALGGIDCPETRTAIMARLEGGDRGGQRAAAVAAVRLKMIEAVPRLIELATREQASMREPFREALGLIGDARALPLIMEDLRVSSRFLRPYSGELLLAASRISGRPFSIAAWTNSTQDQKHQIADSWLDWWEENRDTYEEW